MSKVKLFIISIKCFYVQLLWSPENEYGSKKIKSINWNFYEYGSKKIKSINWNF
jgi:hypothetical protein